MAKTKRRERKRDGNKLLVLVANDNQQDAFKRVY